MDDVNAAAEKPGPSRLLRSVHFWLLLGGLAIFSLTFFSANKYVGSDPKLTLLVSQAVIEQGTVRLDAYQNDHLLDLPFHDYVEDTRLIIERGGHYYAYFPAGPSLLAVPIVWLYNSFGHDMRTMDNFDLQIMLAALSTALVFIVLYRIGTYLVKPWASLIIAFAATAGSSLASTLGTALWTLNFSTLFISLALLLIVRDAAGGRPFNPLILGTLLFLAYFSRAAAAAFIASTLLYLFWQRRSLFWPTALAAAALLAAYLAWTRLEFGQWLPDYYSPARLQVERTPLWIAVLGNLASPSRGIFIFSPFLLLIVAGLVKFWRDLARQPLFWLSTAWIVLLLLLVSRGASWWGGTSFGPRLLTDAMPAFVLLLFLVWREAALVFSPAQRRATAAVFLFLALAATAIHVAGLYRPATVRWNEFIMPNPTESSTLLGDMFNPRYAQFTATNEMVCAIAGEKTEQYLAHDETLAPYHIGLPITAGADRSVPIYIRQTLEQALAATPDVAGSAEEQALPDRERAYLPVAGSAGNMAIFVGWEDAHGRPAERLSICPEAQIIFSLAQEDLDQARYWLVIEASAVDGQTAVIHLNDTVIGEAAWPEGEAGTVSLTFPAELLVPGARNRLRFYFPSVQAGRPIMEGLRLRYDDRQLALRLQSLAILPAPASPATPTPLPYP